MLLEIELQAHLPRYIHAAAGLQHLAENDLPNMLTQPGRHDGIGDGKAEVGGADGFQTTAKAADGRASGVDDMDGVHER